MVELKDVLDDARVESAITDPATRGRASGLVDSVSAKSRKDGTTFTITAGRCTLNARTDYKPAAPGIVGPQEFDVSVDKSANGGGPRR